MYRKQRQIVRFVLQMIQRIRNQHTFSLNLNGQSNKDPQWNPVFFNEKSSKLLEKKMRSLATHELKAGRARSVAELWIRSAD